jgi:hypothetical protein
MLSPRLNSSGDNVIVDVMEEDRRADLALEPCQSALDIRISSVPTNLVPPPIAGRTDGHRLASGPDCFGNNSFGLCFFGVFELTSLTFTRLAGRTIEATVLVLEIKLIEGRVSDLEN